MIPEGFIPYESEIDVGLIGAYVIVIFDKETKNPLARVDPVKGKKEVRITGSITEAMVLEILDMFSHPVDCVFHFSSEGKSFSGSGTADPYTREFFLAGVDEFNRRFYERGFWGSAYVAPKNSILSENYELTENQLQEKARFLNVDYVNLQKLDISRKVTRFVPEDIARYNNLLCIGGTLTVAMEDPTDSEAIKMIKEQTGLNVTPVLAAPDDIRITIHEAYSGKRGESRAERNRKLQQTAESIGVPFVDLATIHFDKELREMAGIIEKPLAERLSCVIIGKDRDKLTVAMEAPTDKLALCTLKDLTGLDIKPVLSSREDIEASRELVYFGIKNGEKNYQSKSEFEMALQRKTVQEQLTQEIDENNLIKAAEVMKIPYVRLSDISIDREIALIIPSSMALRYNLVCIGRKDNTLIIAMDDPLDVFAIDDIRFRTGYDVESVLSSEEDIKAAHRLIYE